MRSARTMIAFSRPPKAPSLEAVRRDAAINRRFALEQQQALSAPQDDNPSDQPRSPNSQRRNRPDRQGKGDDQSPEGQSEGDAGSGGSSRDDEGNRDRADHATETERRGWRRTVGASRCPEIPPTIALTPHSTISARPRTAVCPICAARSTIRYARLVMEPRLQFLAKLIAPVGACLGESKPVYGQRCDTKSSNAG